MGQGSSTSSSSSTTAVANFPRVALHVLRVAAGSPADLAGIQPFFDYLVGVEMVHKRARKPSRKRLGSGSISPLGPSGSGSPVGSDLVLKVNDNGITSSASADGADSDALGVEDEEYYEEPIGLSLDPEELSRVLDENEDREIGLRVYNAKYQKIRYVTLIPSRRWAPASSSNSTSGHTSTTPSQTASGASSQYILGPSLLGLSLKQCDPSEALGQVWHILDVLEGSPAESAGLVPHGDYVIGWTDGPLYNESEFYELVEEFTDKPLRLYVYSSDLDNVREVVLIPNRQWGGEGLLGCGVGYGMLHRIPVPSTVLPSSIPLGIAGRNPGSARSTPRKHPASESDSYFMYPIAQAAI